MQISHDDESWSVYILECGDGTLYTGITNDIGRRVQVHASGKGAKYTRGRGPFQLRYCEKCDSYCAALRREYAIKQLTRAHKLDLCEKWAEGRDR